MKGREKCIIIFMITEKELPFSEKKEEFSPEEVERGKEGVRRIKDYEKKVEEELNKAIKEEKPGMEVMMKRELKNIGAAEKFLSKEFGDVLWDEEMEKEEVGEVIEKLSQGRKEEKERLWRLYQNLKNRVKNEAQEKGEKIDEREVFERALTLLVEGEDKDVKNWLSYVTDERGFVLGIIKNPWDVFKYYRKS